MNTDPIKNTDSGGDKLDGNVKIRTPFTTWVENFWYHHKFGVVAGAFILIFVIVCTVQLFQKKPYDVYVMYAGPVSLSSDEQAAVKDAFLACAKDYDSSGETVVDLQCLYVMTPSQLSAFKSKNDNETDPVKKLDAMTMGMIQQTLSNNAQIFDQEIMSGEAVVCLLDPGQYNVVLNEGGLEPLSEAVGYTPEGAIDEYGIYLKDTEFGKYYSAFNVLPSDTILCIRRISTFSFLRNQNNAKKYHAYAEKYLSDLLSFTVKEFGG